MELTFAQLHLFMSLILWRRSFKSWSKTRGKLTLCILTLHNANTVVVYRAPFRSFLSTNRLTCHGGIIPEDEIWIKLGGDKGGDTMKLSFQVVNVATPNSVKNTMVFSVFAARDTPTNLHIAVDRYRDQVTTLQATKWRYIYTCT